MVVVCDRLNNYTSINGNFTTYRWPVLAGIADAASDVEI
jgi:hypothetical protein